MPDQRDLGVASASLKKRLEALNESTALKGLGRALNQFNIFEAVGMTRAEIRHSHFLAFLLNPREKHGFGDSVIRGLLSYATSGLDAKRRECLDQPGALGSIEVERERFRIDILLTDQHQRIAVIIENKIDSTEHSDQLARYLDIVQNRHPGWTIVPVFLTPDGERPSHPAYSPVGYEAIIEVLEKVLDDYRGHTELSVKLAIDHYLSLLRRNIVADSELQAHAQQIYMEHESALEFIFRHRQSRRAQIAKFLEELVQGTVHLRHLKSPANGRYIQFLNEDWDTEEMRSNWRPTYRLLLFQFDNEPDHVTLHLMVGPADNPNRAKLLKHFQRAGSLLAPQWDASKAYVALYSRPFLRKQDLQTADWEEIRSELLDAWEQFVEDDLQSILKAIDIEKIIALPDK